jgi:hypothetical protein
MSRPNHSDRRNAVIEILYGLYCFFHRAKKVDITRMPDINLGYPIRIYLPHTPGADTLSEFPMIAREPRISAERISTTERIKRYYDVIEACVEAEIGRTLSAVAVEPASLLLGLGF